MAKAKMTTEDLLGVFEEMSVLELSEFLKAFEETFDVTAAAPMAMAVAAPGAGGTARSAARGAPRDRACSRRAGARARW